MKDTLKKIGTFIIIIIIAGITYLIENDFKLPLLEEENKVEYRIEETTPTINQTVDGNFHIYYIDVGQADCILIENNKKYALIDAGNNEDGPKLVQYFNSLGITDFEYVIGTHAHEDHIGGMDDIINNYNIKHFYMPDVVTTTKTFEDIIDSLENKQYNFETPEIDSSFNLADSTFKVLYIGSESQDLNDTSIILKLTYHKTSYLFTGDTTSKIEKQILDKDLKSDVLKVAHHGSQYSNSAQFLKAVEAKYAIIEVGKNNEYNHPQSVVLNKLKKLNTKIYRTDKDGTIILTSDGENISFQTIKTDTNGGSQ